MEVSKAKTIIVFLSISIVSWNRLHYSRRIMWRKLFYFMFFLVCLINISAVQADILEDSSAATIYVYFNIANDDDDSSLSMDKFQKQVEEIGIGNYTAMSLSELLQKEDNGEAVPPTTIALTFDEPDTETYARAFPILIEQKIPFAIFISPGSTTEQEWSALQNLQQSGLVTIGLTSYSYEHNGSWNEEKLIADLNAAKSLYREKLNAEPLFFAYPFGEYSTIFVETVRKLGFKAAFGQNSGVLTHLTDRMKLPRFTMTDEFGDLDRFRMTSNAMPLPVKDLQPDISYLPSLPAIGFTIDEKMKHDGSKTKCFASGDTQPDTIHLDSGRIEIRFKEMPVTDRLRINCTITVPGEFPEDEPRYRWLGYLMYFPVAASQVDTSPVQP